MTLTLISLIEARNYSSAVSRTAAIRKNVFEIGNKPLTLTQYYTEYCLSEIEKPAAGKGEVLVRIHASGINPLDLKIKAGQAAHARTRLPAILGMDMAGIVEAVGEGVSRFKPGDAVYGMTGGIAGVQGTLAEYAAVDADLLAVKPANLTMQEAAGKLKPLMDTGHYGIENISEAYTVIQERKTNGKVVVNLPIVP